MREIDHGEGHRWTKTSVVDEEAVDHERVFGVIHASGDTIRVRVAQRVDYDLLAEPIRKRAYQPRINVGDYELTSTQTRDLIQSMCAAEQFADTIDHTIYPRLVTEA
jgi:hypothetical protein